MFSIISISLLQINTASRKESSGVSNRIHNSQATASVLIDAAKEKWIIPRAEMISAKGKGELTTYFFYLPDQQGDDKTF
jgi:hypothetical protein